MTAATWTQEDFRFIADDGSLTTATLLGAGNNSDVTITYGDKFRLRSVIQVAGMTTNNQQFEIHSRKNETGGYTIISTVTANVQNVADDNSIGDNATTVQRIGDGTYITGESLGFDTNGLTGNCDCVVAEEVEVEFCLQFEGTVADADFFDLRVYLLGETALDTYSFTPRVTVDRPVAAFPYGALARDRLNRDRRLRR